MIPIEAHAGSGLRSTFVHRVRRPLVALIALVAAVAIGYGVRALDSSHHHPIGTVRETSLPRQAVVTIARIAHGGPFPYPGDDGTVFHNYEHDLPAEPDGWYREYTVPTPGSPDRGARRIVAGRNGVLYYTGDHYETFERVTGVRP
jgi:ribonuclease T1